MSNDAPSQFPHVTGSPAPVPGSVHIQYVQTAEQEGYFQAVTGGGPVRLSPADEQEQSEGR